MQLALWITKEELHRLYWEECISIPKIAAQYGQTYDKVLRQFQIWDIPRQKRGALVRKYHTEEARQEGKRQSWRKYRRKPGIQNKVYTKGSRRWQLASSSNWEKHLSRVRVCGKKRYARTMRFIERVKRMFGCCGCGCKCAAMLDFHHRDPQTKKYSIGGRLSLTIHQLKEEMRKCSVICVNCHREQHFAGKITSYNYKYINRVALLCGCRKCGYRKCAAALEFHHRDPKSKKFNIKNYKGKSLHSIKEEMRKCDVLCGNCHREHHWQQRLSILNPSQL